jgi:hypothetical protein
MAKARNESAADVKDQLKGVAAGVKDGMVDVADEAKSNGVDQISGVGRAVHSAAEELGRELPQAAGAAMVVTGEIIDAKTVVLIQYFGERLRARAGTQDFI